MTVLDLEPATPGGLRGRCWVAGTAALLLAALLVAAGALVVALGHPELSEAIVVGAAAVAAVGAVVAAFGLPSTPTTPPDQEITP